jgi:hypothetical protein
MRAVRFLILFISIPFIISSSSKKIEKFEKVSLEKAFEKGCLSCHEGIEDINKKMIKNNVKCVTCHFGNPIATTKKEAHKGMIKNPSDFRFINKTCGQCHSSHSTVTNVVINGEKDHVDRMKKALMATTAGEISGARYLWGKQVSKDAVFGVRKIIDKDGSIPLKFGALKELKILPAGNNSHVDNLLRNYCLKCHLWTEGEKKYGYYRGSGCAACHMIYADDGLSRSSDPTIDKTKPSHPVKHEITNIIPVNQCLHCHKDIGGGIGYGFVGKDFNGFKLTADIHYRKGMICIDCHTSKELHGDGNIYSKKEEQVFIRCESCHGTPDEYPSLKDIRGNRLRNLYRRGNDIILIGKADGREHIVPDLKRMNERGALPKAMMIEKHFKGPHRLECYSCHSKKVLQCYGCHIKRDDRGNSYDWISGRNSPGKWEGSYKYIRINEPPLGINSKDKVSPFTPGCQIFFSYIDRNGKLMLKDKIFRTSGINKGGEKMYGLSMNPIQPHTITREARDCGSCHANTKAMGIGLKRISEKPEDLLIDFPLEKIVDEKGIQIQDTSHNKARPFNEEELERINSCYVCHYQLDNPDIWMKINDIYEYFKKDKKHIDIYKRIFNKGMLRE